MTASRAFARIGPVMWLVLQGVATVASILLAFGIDAWWDQRTVNAEKDVLLEAVKAEMQSDLAWVGPECAYRRAAADNTRALLNAVAAGRYDDAEKTLDRRLGDLLWTSPLRFSTGAVDSLLSSGRATAIGDTRLRALLAEYPRRVEEIAALGHRDERNFLEVVTSFLSRNAGLLQISNEAYRNGMPPNGAFADPTGVIPLAAVSDHTPLLRNPEFAGAVTRTLWVHDRVILDMCGGMLEQVDEIVRLIDQELGRVH